MKRFTFLSLLILISATLLTFTSAFAANSFKYKESYRQRVLCSSYYGYCDVFGYGMFNISVKLSLESKSIDFSQIDGNTPFYFEVGNVYGDVFLGDGQYVPGKKTSKVSFVFSDYDWVTDKYNVHYMWIKLSWDAKNLMVSIKGLTGIPDIEYPIIAYDYLYYDRGTYPVSLPGYVSFAGAKWAFDLRSRIKVTQFTKKDKYKDLWDLWSITSSGKGYEVPVE